MNKTQVRDSSYIAGYTILLQEVVGRYNEARNTLVLTALLQIKCFSTLILSRTAQDKQLIVSSTLEDISKH